MSGPDVSVVVPTRNRLHLLAQTLRTVLDQDVDLEVIVVDEGSSDATPQWLAAHPDPRLRVVRHERPRGLSEARNAGIAMANGRWLAFTDDDDLWMPNKLADQLAAAEDAAAPWAFGGAVDFTEEPRLLHVSRPRYDHVLRLPWNNLVPGGGSNAIVSRAAIEAVGGFDPRVNIVADWDMWLRLLDLGDPAVVEHPVMAYRIHGSNMSKNVDEMLDGIRELDRRYAHLRDGQPLAWHNVYAWLWVRALNDDDRSTARRLAWLAVREGHPGSARRLLRACVPVKARLPVNTPDGLAGFTDRVRPRAVVAWPPGIESWLREVLDVTP